VVGAVDQGKTRRRIVARSRDLFVGPTERVAALAHPRFENGSSRMTRSSANAGAAAKSGAG
jgi:hypothetical protein